MVPPQVNLEPKQLGFGWWALQCVGLVVSLGLMGALAFALMMLTRMPVEGTTQPDVHLPTLVVWFVLCSVLIVGSMLRGTWRELADERVHVDAAGNELRIDRWSPPHERERFVERVAADTRHREKHLAEREASVAEPSAHREMSDEQMRAAAHRRREVGPGISTSVRTGRWSSSLRRLRWCALACLYGWLPVSILAAVVMDFVLPDVPGEWGLLAMLLLPIGWLLMEVHQVLRHRWLATRETRSDLALFHGTSAVVGAFVCGLVGFVGLVDREFIGLALICFPLTVLLCWIAKRELRHFIPSRSGGEGGGGSDLHVDLSWID